MSKFSVPAEEDVEMALSEANVRGRNVDSWVILSSTSDPMGFITGGAFWFDTKEELLDLAYQFPFLMSSSEIEDEDLETVDDFRKELGLLKNEEFSSQKLTSLLDSVMPPGENVQYAGSVKELLSGDSEFALALRRNYFELDESDEDVPCVPKGEYDDFLDSLDDWGNGNAWV